MVASLSDSRKTKCHKPIIVVPFSDPRAMSVAENQLQVILDQFDMINDVAFIQKKKTDGSDV